MGDTIFSKAPEVASSLGLSSQNQQKATNAFSGAVESFTRQTLSDVASGGFESGTGAALSNADSAIADAVNAAFGSGGGVGGRAWQSSKYAEDLIKYAPKNRFIFKVKFVFNPPYSNSDTEFSYVVRNIDKPTVNFEYDEVNMYNFKTKILRTVQHEPLNMMFHDDIQNRVLDFFNFYRTAHSPVSNMTIDQTSTMEEMGMAFQDPADVDPKTGAPKVPYSAASGVLMNNTKNLLKYIELSQVYAHGSRVNRFYFINPKIINFDFDNVDHENSDGNALTCSFAYDSLYVEDDVTPSGTPSPVWGNVDVMGNNENATPKLELPNAVGSAAHSGKKNPTAGAANERASTTGSVYGDIAIAAGGSWLANKAADSINSKVSGSAFGKQFQNAGGALSGALGGLANNLIGSGVELAKSGVATVREAISDDPDAPEEGDNG